MKQLKSLLQFKLFWFLIIIFTIVFVIINVKVERKSIYNLSEKEFTGTIINIKENDYGYSLTIKSRENLVAYVKRNNYKLGDYVKLEGILEEPKNNTIPNNFNYKDYLRYKKIYYILKVDNISLIKENTNLIYKIKNSLLSYINNFKSKDYLKNFLFGDTSYLDNNIYKSFQINGVCHLLSISSMPINILIYLLYKLFKRIKLNDITSNIIILLLIYFYFLLSNYSIVVLRIFIFLILKFLNKKLKLNLDIIKLFLLTTIITLIINPFYIYNKGFVYSYSISFIIILNKDKLQGNYLIKLLKIASLSFIYSIPFNIYYNYSINLLSIIYNVIFIPIINFIIYPLSLITLLIPFLDNIFFNIFNFVIKFSQILNNITFGILILKKMSVIILLLYMIIFTYIIYSIFNYKKNRLILLIVILVLHYNVNAIIPNNYFITIDVNQGDSSLFYSNNVCILIDTGGIYNKNISEDIITMLKSFGIRKIDSLLLTHGDYDHMGEAINLVNNFKVEKVIFNCGEFNNLEQDLIKVLDKKKIPYYSCIKELNIDDNKLYFLQTKEYDNENDNSNVIYTEINGYKFMFMGDAGIEKEKDISDKYNIYNVDVLKVGHHGSKTSSSKSFIDDMNPKYSIISVGKNNRYGHPNKEVLNNLEKSKIFRTDQDGSIIFKIKNNRLEIETCSP
ncbi:MAG: DNA internalization-related competence protein ComEC/Rec2 [Bacilli bacterium]|nr:DNA internalization-related competence protein ComEC/Rec2 [Bacilli bacterium]